MTTILDDDNPTLESVNQALLRRLAKLVEAAEPEYILDITESVAKLNASLRNNQVFSEPETEAQRAEREAREMFSGLQEAMIDGET